MVKLRGQSSSDAEKGAGPRSGSARAVSRRPTAADAIDIWIARWLKIPRRALLARYGCDPRRLYEIWEQKRFPGSREAALAAFRARFPNLADRVDFGPHRTVPRKAQPELQLTLFDDLPPRRRPRATSPLGAAPRSRSRIPNKE